MQALLTSPQTKKGFTLIELLVAISIIATLTAIVLPNFMGARERAKDAQKKEDMYALKNALRMVYNDNQAYPDSQTDMLAEVLPYLPNVASFDYPYTYTQTNTGDGFQLCVELEASSAEDNFASQNRCKVSEQVCALPVVENTNTNIYVICGN